MSHPSPRNSKGSIAAAAITALLLMTPLSAAFATPPAILLEAGSGAFITAKIGAPADESEHTKNTAVSFTDASTASESCPITSWRWTFGDGTNSTAQNPTHTYPVVGSYVVALQVRSSSCTTLVSTTSIDVHIVGIPPVVSLDGPTTAAAGDSLTFTATASDTDGGSVVGYIFSVNGVASPQQVDPTFVTALTQAGTNTVSVVAVDDDNAASAPASLSVEVSAGPLAAIVVDAPASAVVGSIHTILTSGADAYGNPVPISTSSFQHQFRNTTGPEEVCHTEENISGCDTTQVLADGLASIEVTGEGSIVVNTTGTWNTTGFDVYGNTVPLETTTVDFTAPTTAGFYDVCYTEQNITGCKSVAAVADVAVSLEINGSTEAIVGSTETYLLSALDQYNNSALLSNTSIDHTMPLTPQSITVCYTETVTVPAPITDCIDVEVVAAPLDRIDITGPDSMPVNTTATFFPAGFDVYNNSIALNVTEFNYTAGTQAGVFPVCYDEQGIQGCKNVTLTPLALANLTIVGPDQLAAGASENYTLLGKDRYGNVVAVENDTFVVLAPTATGAIQVCQERSGITACKSIQIVAGPLATITVDGPATLVVNTNGTYTLDGADQYGNAVNLTTDTLDYIAPQTAGPADLCYTEQEITGCLTIDVVADSLFAITVTGPDVVVAGSTTEFAVSGADEFGNAVTLSNATTNFTAPTAIGSASVCYSEQNVSGCKVVEVTVDQLAVILVSGPDEVEAGASAAFYHVGLDQYGNVVDLDVIVQSFTAPTTIGTASICHTEQGITGCKTVSIIGGPAVSLTVTGPAEMLAGSTATFAVSGVDQYGNPAGLETNSFAFTAPSTVGPTQACYSEDGVTDCTDVTVLQNPLAKIVVSGPAKLVAGATGTYTLSGFDSGGNSTPLSFPTLDFTAPLAFGTTKVCYSENGITGCQTISVVPLRISVSAPYDTVNVGRATQMTAIGYDVNDQPVVGGAFSWSATRGSVSATGVFTPTQGGSAVVTASLGGVSAAKGLTVVTKLTVAITLADSFNATQPVTGSVKVLYVDGTGAAGVSVELTFFNHLLEPLGRSKVFLTTGSNGEASFSAPVTASTPGEHSVSAAARLDVNSGQAADAYTIRGLL